MRSGTAWRCARAALACAWLLDAALASAEEPVVVLVETSGDCPSRDQIGTALAAVGVGLAIEGDADAWLVRTARASGAARLELIPPGETVPVEERSIASPDCDALAQSFALIVATHFTDIGLTLAEPSAVVVPPIAAPPIEPPPVEAPHAPPPVPSRWEIAIGAAGGFSFEPLLGAWNAAIDVSWLPTSGPFVVRALFAFIGPTTQGAPPDDVTRLGMRPGIELGLRAGLSPVWVQLLVGFVVEIASISNPAFPSLWRAQPGIGLSSAVGIELVPSLYLRFEAAAQVWLTYDAYRIDPEGEVAQSPVFSGTLGGALLYMLE